MKGNNSIGFSGLTLYLKDSPTKSHEVRNLLGQEMIKTRCLYIGFVPGEIYIIFLHVFSLGRGI